jgi:hypothetical protein
MGSQMMMTVSSAQKKAGLKAECLVAEASAVQMVVMAGTYCARKLLELSKTFSGKHMAATIQQKCHNNHSLERSVAFHKKSVVATATSTNTTIQTINNIYDVDVVEKH